MQPACQTPAASSLPAKSSTTPTNLRSCWPAGLMQQSYSCALPPVSLLTKNSNKQAVFVCTLLYYASIIFTVAFQEEEQHCVVATNCTRQRVATI